MRFVNINDWRNGMEKKKERNNFESIAINHQFLFNLCKYVRDIYTYVS